uniref:Uncharacterized protein n=1 Tax=viral metagenome TaxID=1070528 RepID=A0A6M3IEA7_9ZZZZ
MRSIITFLLVMLATASYGQPYFYGATPWEAKNTHWVEAGDDLAATIAKAQAGDAIKVFPGTYTAENVVIGVAIDFRGEGTATWTGTDTLLSLGIDGCTFEGISFASTNSNGIMNLGAYEATFTKCSFSCSTFNAGSDTVEFIDCDFSVLSEDGMAISGGLKTFTDCRWGSEHEIATYNPYMIGGDAYLYNCQLWGDSSALHGSGTPGIATNIYAYNSLFKSRGGDNYAVGFSNIARFDAYNCQFFSSTANKATVLWHDSSYVNLYSPTIVNTAASSQVALKGYTQGTSYIANPVCTGSIVIDSCDVAGSDDGFTYLDGFITTTGGIIDKQLLAKFSKQRGANISGTNYASYFNIAPDSAAFTAVKAIMLRDTIGVAAGSEGYIGFDSKNTGIITEIDQIKFISGDNLSLLQGAKLRFHNGSAWVNAIYNDGAKVMVASDTLKYDGGQAPNP